MAKQTIQKKVQEKINLDEKKKNYLKNYCILFVIFTACVAITLYLCKSYEVYKEYEREIPVIRGSLYEINPDELEHFVVENSEAIIYICTALDDDCRSFEKDFKKFIRRNEIIDEIVYLNVTGVDLDEFVKNFNQTYHSKNKLNGNYPAFVAFQDGRIISILQGNSRKKITISKLQNFLELNLQEEEEEIEEGTVEEEA